MIWKIFTQATEPRKHRIPTSRVRYRPHVQLLEDRTVPSPVVFTEVQNQSILSLSGTIGGSPIQEQGPGALTTTYFGTFLTDIDEANGTIRFTQTGNDFCAADTGNWAPLSDGSSGTAPAIYGLQADVMGAFLGAIRDFHMNADTGGSALPLYQNDDGSFGYTSGQTIAISAGTGTYAHPTLGPGPINLSGLNGPNQAGDGTLIDNGSGTLLLTVPISVSYSGTIAGLDLTLNMDGQIVGSASYSGPSIAGQARIDPTTGAALAARFSAVGSTAQAAIVPDAPASARVTAEAAGPVHAAASNDAVVPLGHHAVPVSLDPWAALEGVLQELG